MKKAPFIFVCERGFVIVGRIASEDTLTITLNDVAVVRRWGTTRGLGQLAMEGPLLETILEPEPDGTTQGRMSVYRQIPCDQKAWSKYGS